MIDEIIFTYGIDGTPAVLDKIKNFGYKYATISGVTWSIDNVHVPEGKPALVLAGRAREEEATQQFNEGLLSEEERYKKVLEIWEQTKLDIEKLIPATLDTKGSVYDMVTSGARGTMGNITQMAGMKGLIQNNQGRTIEFPIIPSYKEGFSPMDYFISTHGSRKGLSDTALNTAKAGYLTRRLVDVAQDMMITEDDCGTKEGWLTKRKYFRY